MVAASWTDHRYRCRLLCACRLVARRYDGLYDEAPEADGEAAVGEVAAGTSGATAGDSAVANGLVLLREWVPVASLRPPPSPPEAGWHRGLSVGGEAAVLYDGGWCEPSRPHALRHPMGTPRTD